VAIAFAGGGLRQPEEAAPRTGVRRNGVPFLARWLLVTVVALLVGSCVEYVLAERQLTARALEEAARNYESEAHALEDVLNRHPDLERRTLVIRNELRHVQETAGTVYVGLFNAKGRLVASTAQSSGRQQSVDPDRLAEVLSTGRPTVEAEADPGESADGGRYEFLLPVRSPDGLLVLEIDQRGEVISALTRDLQERKVVGLLVAALIALPLSYLLGGRRLNREHQRSERAADTDPLTGLVGRRPFRPLLEEALGDPAASPVALALIDLDAFKQVNDRLGHSYGDRVLIALAESFEGLRATETAFRLGGDEFAVVLRGVDDEGAGAAMQRVRDAFAGRIPGVTFSCGIASTAAGDVLSQQELWERSDAALYEAKRRGRRQTVTFDAMTVRHSVSSEKLDAVTALLEPDSPLTVAFQPIWDLRTGAVLAHEALLRLPHGCLLAGPQEAFELAQRLGAAPQLDARARAAVLASVRNRPWLGLLFLNIHPDALLRLDVESLGVELAAAGLEPADVVLEVTEQAGLDQPEPIRLLKRARDAGFRLALDDMGHSNAGLRALTHVRFDIVKIDRQIVARLGDDPASAATVAAATTFVQQAGGWVIAEGIEDTRMLSAVLRGTSTSSGHTPVLAGQGFLLGRPDAQPVELTARLPVLDEQRRHVSADESV